MPKATEKEVKQFDKLADKLLATVMESEMDNPIVAILSIGHVGSIIANEIGLTEREFLFYMLEEHRKVLQMADAKGVH
jgi:hypothetical protein